MPTYGRYWQGRYSLPFAVGVPLVLAVRTVIGDRSARTSMLVDRLAPYLGAAVWTILNFGFAAALQRWGVGLSGSWFPWQWSTYETPVAPWLLLLVHAGATAWLVSLCRSRARRTLRTRNRRREYAP